MRSTGEPSMALTTRARWTRVEMVGRSMRLSVTPHGGTGRKIAENLADIGDATTSARARARIAPVARSGFASATTSNL